MSRGVGVVRDEETKLKEVKTSHTNLTVVSSRTTDVLPTDPSSHSDLNRHHEEHEIDEIPDFSV